MMKLRMKGKAMLTEAESKIETWPGALIPYEWLSTSGNTRGKLKSENSEWGERIQGMTALLQRIVYDQGGIYYYCGRMSPNGVDGRTEM
jgi:hypothetical protein